MPNRDILIKAAPWNCLMSFMLHCFNYGVTVALAFVGFLYMFITHDMNYLSQTIATNSKRCGLKWLLQSASAVESPMSVHSEDFNEDAFQLTHQDSYVPDPGDLRRYRNDIHVAITACGKRFEEALNNIKSCLLFARSRIIYHIFADKEHHGHFKERINAWPLRFRKNFLYTLYPITYPNDGKQEMWRRLFKPCATQRLFLPMSLTGIDSVLYVDSDTLFLNAVEEIWRFFKKFDDSHVLSSCLDDEKASTGWYNRFARHPFYGIAGINTGVLLMNLTRIRSSMFKTDIYPNPVGWGEIFVPLFSRYRSKMRGGDQDLLNILFHYNPEKVFVTPCHWNYRYYHCQPRTFCMDARKEGVKLMHGLAEVFIYNRIAAPGFTAVFEAIRDYGFQGNYTEFIIKPLEVALSKVSETDCGKESETILKGLKNNVKNMTEGLHAIAFFA